MACPTGYFRFTPRRLVGSPGYLRILPSCRVLAFNLRFRPSYERVSRTFWSPSLLLPVCFATWNARHGARADGYVMPKILPDFGSCDKGARCPGALDKLERRSDDTEDVIRERYCNARMNVHGFYIRRCARGLGGLLCPRSFQVWPTLLYR